MISQGLTLLGRAIREPAVHTTAAVASLPVATAGMHAVGLTANLDTDALASMASGLVDQHLWLTLAMAALFGSLGGVVAELLSLHGKIELPHRVKHVAKGRGTRLADPRYEVDLGIGSRMVLGAAAGLALLCVYTPETATALVVNALVAGSVATGFLRLVQRRLLAKNNNNAAASAQAVPAKPRKVAPKAQLSVVRAAAPIAQ